MPQKQIKLEIKERLIALAQALVDQKKAEVKVEPMERSSGFWYGGGDMIQEADGSLVICGRYRNFGDSRTGVEAGTRGLECALFRAPGFDKPFEKIKAFTKAELTCNGKEVTSIEGTSFRQTPEGAELYISSEKAIPYPEEVKSFQKPGTGVWTIDLIDAPTASELSPANIREVLAGSTPAGLHVKDPVIADDGARDAQLIYCIHPFAWSSSYSGLAVRKQGTDNFEVINANILPRGPVWDIAASRVTDRMPVPQVGVLKDLPPLSLYFYDGAECLRQHDENPRAVKRPRGWSCEEIGGVAWGWDDDCPNMERLSINAPLFVSHQGTGCSRYVATLVTDDTVYATWQQSQDDLSQPLVGHSLSMEEVGDILS
ncbi:exo-alpha-sialidase [Planctomycetota bacterium]